MGAILLTGGLGFIGSHTAVELQQAGHEVVVVDNLSNSRLEVLNGIKNITGVEPVFEQLDVANEAHVKQLFEKYTFSGCIHFAAHKAVSESVEQPLKYYHNNISSLIYLLEAFKKQGAANFIFSSSCTVYGQADVMPITEDAAIKMAESPYGNTKQIGEQMIRDAVNAHDELKAISLRYFNPIGAHHSAEIGELPIGVPMNLVPFITQTAAGLRQELKVYGNDYPTPDGTAIRDYIHVVDLAKAHVKALERLLNEASLSRYEVFNLGTGRGSSVLEVIKAFEEVTEQKLNWAFAQRRDGDITQAYADTRKANDILGWKAEKDIKDCVRDAWRWQEKLGK